MEYLAIPSPFGALTLFADNEALIVLDWGRGGEGGAETPLLVEAAGQLAAYFDGKLTAFDLPMAPQGTDFQMRVWQAMQAIPYGETRSYADIARDLGSAPRAVGGACGRNPLPILIPCHRVVGAGGKLTGYSGGEGVETKEALLRLEGLLDD
ncbi:MAG: methylated-DNA--[protein]-cysteine S-methyltransferase [Rhodospirillales bacterium]